MGNVDGDSGTMSNGNCIEDRCICWLCKSDFINRKETKLKRQISHLRTFIVFEYVIFTFDNK